MTHKNGKLNAHILPEKVCNFEGDKPICDIVIEYSFN